MESTVAVILRTRNRPVLLRRALASILAQSRHAERVVVVNDGGDRQALEILLEQEGLAGDDRFTLVHHEESVGRSESLNVGLAAAGSTHVAIHDDDDSWHPGFLAATLAWLDAHPSAGAVASRTAVVHEELDEHGVREIAREDFARHVRAATLVEMVWGNFMPPVSMLVRRSAIDEVGGFDPALPVLEDWEFNLRLMSRFAVGLLDGPALAFWHHRSRSTGDDGNSVFADSADHQRYDVVIRDEFLRGERNATVAGLGGQLTTAYLVRRSMAEVLGGQVSASEVADRWGRSHNDHLASVATTLQIEVGRVGGDVLAMRERVVALQDSLALLQSGLVKTVRVATRPMRRTVFRVSRQVDELWRTDRGVAQLAKHRDRSP